MMPGSGVQGLTVLEGADDAGMPYVQDRRRPNQPFQATAKSTPRLNGRAFDRHKHEES